MITTTWTDVRDFLQAHLCYQFFITPLPIPLEKEYRDFAQRGMEFLATNRSDVIHCHTPRHHVIHYFAPKEGVTPNNKKVLITHGWMSRSAYMTRTIRALWDQGYEIYALDFPAHGESKGLQVTWLDSVTLLRQLLNNYGPFYAVVGHSYGGSMLLNTLNLANQLPEWEITNHPEKAILIASPINIRTPVTSLARRFNLSNQGYLQFRNTIKQRSNAHLRYINFRNFIHYAQTPVLCIHGKDDITISPQESIKFCRRYPYASLALLPEVDHVGVLIDKRVEKIVSNFLV